MPGTGQPVRGRHSSARPQSPELVSKAYGIQADLQTLGEQVFVTFTDLPVRPLNSDKASDEQRAVKEGDGVSPTFAL